jgi:hypothetical protein
MDLAPFCNGVEWLDEKLELNEGRRDGCQVLIYIDVGSLKGFFGGVRKRGVRYQMEIFYCRNSR